MTPAPLLAALVLSLPAAPTYVLNLGAGTEARVREPGDATTDDPSPERAFDADFGARALVAAIVLVVFAAIGWGWLLHADDRAWMGARLRLLAGRSA